MTTQKQEPPKQMNRRTFLSVSAGIASAALLPVPEISIAGTRANPSADLEVLSGYTPVVSSAWIPGKDHENALDRVRQVLESITDFSWLSKGDRVLLKIALNSGNPFPATSDPWLLKCMIRILKEKGAGEILVGDQSGVADVYWTRKIQQGSSRDLCKSAGLLDVIKESGATPVFFEEKGYDAYFETFPEGTHHWKAPLMITSLVRKVDHIIFMPRVAAHLMGDITAALKLGVGFLREDSRLTFHSGGDDFYAMYQEINEVREIKSRLRFTLASGRKVLSTFGPDQGDVAEPAHGLIFASKDLLASELLSYAWLLWNREFETSGLARFTRGNFNRFRSFINKKLIEKVWAPADQGEIAEIPMFRAGNIYDHPAIMNHMIRRGGKPAGIAWNSVNGIDDPLVSTYLKQQLSGNII